MAVGALPPWSSPSYHPGQRQSSSSSVDKSIFHSLEEDSRDMTEPIDIPSAKGSRGGDNNGNGGGGGGSSSSNSNININNTAHLGMSESASSNGALTPSSPPTPGQLSRTGSFSDFEETAMPVERLTVFDLLENLALPQRLEKLQNSIAARTERVLRQRERFRSSTKDKVIEEWRRRVPTAEEQLDRYRRRMRTSVDRLMARWNNSRSVTLREKTSFIAGVLNVFISGYLIGGHPELFHYWYTAQLVYFMPIRMYNYKKKGYHYFLADLCYFVNLLTLLSIYVFPRSKRLFISTWCLAYGNNAIAVAMWRNSMVFHSMDKVVSLFIHIMPCVTLHCLVHLIPKELQAIHYPAIHTILYSEKTSPEHYSLPQMMFWASWPYAIWQLSYHFLISVRRRDKIAAGRPTSFTWLRRSFANVWIGRFVLSLPEAMQEPAYMAIQYVYALLTMLPCSLWFWSRWASGIFLSAVFAWSIWNGATYYIDVFGTRFQKELEALKKDVAKWQSGAVVTTPGISSPPFTPGDPLGGASDKTLDLPVMTSPSEQELTSLGEGVLPIPGLAGGTDLLALDVDAARNAVARDGSEPETPKADGGRLRQRKK